MAYEEVGWGVLRDSAANVWGVSMAGLKGGQILALSGGGFRGLYTASVIEQLEARTRVPFGRHFDLIAGTSIGGIIALALAMEKPASQIVQLFTEHGALIF